MANLVQPFSARKRPFHTKLCVRTALYINVWFSSGFHSGNIACPTQNAETQKALVWKGFCVLSRWFCLHLNIFMRQNTMCHQCNSLPFGGYTNQCQNISYLSVHVFCPIRPKQSMTKKSKPKKWIDSRYFAKCARLGLQAVTKREQCSLQWKTSLAKKMRGKKIFHRNRMLPWQWTDTDTGFALVHEFEKHFSAWCFRQMN